MGGGRTRSDRQRRWPEFQASKMSWRRGRGRAPRRAAGGAARRARCAPDPWSPRVIRRGAGRDAPARGAGRASRGGRETGGASPVPARRGRSGGRSRPTRCASAEAGPGQRRGLRGPSLAGRGASGVEAPQIAPASRLRHYHPAETCGGDRGARPPSFARCGATESEIEGLLQLRRLC